MKPINNVLDEYNVRHQIANLFKRNPYAMVNYEITITGVNGFVICSGNGGPTMKAERRRQSFLLFVKITEKQSNCV